MSKSDTPSIVLVHGGFVDGSGWQGVYEQLTKDGYSVSVVQNPTLSLADDVAVTSAPSTQQGEPVDPRRPFLRRGGHHRGGQPSQRCGARLYRGLRAGRGRVGEHPDRGSAPGAPVPPILPPQEGFLFLDREKFHASFAGDLSAEQAAFMADSQVPWGVDALGGAISEPAWRSKPSWYLVTTEDRMIPPPAQRQMSARAGSTVIEVAGSHAVYVSQPEAVADLIKAAVNATIPVAVGA